MWVLIVMLLDPFGNVVTAFSFPMPDQEACEVRGDQFVRSTPVPDTYHCVDLSVVMGGSVGM